MANHKSALKRIGQSERRRKRNQHIRSKMPKKGRGKSKALDPLSLPVELQTALEAAHTIAGYNAPAVRLAKEAVNRAHEVSLAEGMLHERRLFQAAFATEGQKEGMNAFLAKRAPVFRHR